MKYGAFTRLMVATLLGVLAPLLASPVKTSRLRKTPLETSNTSTFA